MLCHLTILIYFKYSNTVTLETVLVSRNLEILLFPIAIHSFKCEAFKVITSRSNCQQISILTIGVTFESPEWNAILDTVSEILRSVLLFKFWTHHLMGEKLKKKTTTTKQTIYLKKIKFKFDPHQIYDIALGVYYLCQ